jgi:hypothetical protein
MKGSDVHTQCEHESRLLVESRVVFLELRQAIIDGILVQLILIVVAFVFPRRLKALDCWESAPESWSFVCQEVLLNAVGILS